MYNMRGEEGIYAGMKYRWWVVIAIGLFGVGIIIGLVAPPSITNLLSEELAALGELGSTLAPFTFSMFIFIFIKNIITLLFSFALSPIFCLVPILTLAVNGWLVALVSTIIMKEESLGFVLAGLLPHGVIELPAFFIGEAAALSFGTMAVVALFRKEKRNLLLPSLKRNLKYLWIALALMLPAAAIETYLTPLLVG
jgi:stage II sporulation protein M